MSKSVRNKLDHLTGKDFLSVICNKCSDEFYVMYVDKDADRCPVCDNPESEPNEKDTSPESC